MPSTPQIGCMLNLTNRQGVLLVQYPVDDLELNTVLGAEDLALDIQLEVIMEYQNQVVVNKFLDSQKKSAIAKKKRKG